MNIRQNKIKHKLSNGDIATAVMTPMPITADLIEYMGPYGFDGVWIETEHAAIDFADIPDMTRAADLWNMTSIVRLNLNLPGVIYRTLDVGAQAIVMPHVDTKLQAEEVVKAAKFYPLGARGNYTSRQGIGVENFAQKANDETMIVVLIEDILAVNNLKEILEVDHIDVFYVAPGDLAQSMGLLGKPNHPEVLKTVDKALIQIQDAGRVAGTLVNDDSVESYLEKGVKFVTTAIAPWLEKGAKDFLGRCNK
jgi:4-hydroxy-2-oxoheptanedioate aldolase|tara:strand:- start:476 stop:1228 length:753 start_codon:yes stop_codon:yes gene_type:complete